MASRAFAPEVHLPSVGAPRISALNAIVTFWRATATYGPYHQNKWAIPFVA